MCQQSDQEVRGILKTSTVARVGNVINNTKLYVVANYSDYIFLLLFHALIIESSNLLQENSP